MKTVRLFSILATFLFVSSCAELTERVGGQPCNTNVCFVKVTVHGCGNITAEPYELVIAANNVNMEIHWDITGAQFTSNGINFKDPSVAGGEFQDPALLNPTKFRWKNRHTKQGRYGYNIDYTVAGTACTRWDPIIVNN